MEDIEKNNNNSVKFKIYFKEIIRRTTLSTEEISFVNLATSVQKIFNLDATKKYKLTWEDEEKDLVLFTSDTELKEAIQCCNGTLKIVVKEEGEDLAKRDPQNLVNMLDVFKELISSISSQNVNISNNNNNNNNGDKKRKEHEDFNYPESRIGLATCDCCNEKIVGKRLKCEICQDYDLCEICSKINEDQPFHAHSFKIVNGSSFRKRFCDQIFQQLNTFENSPSFQFEEKKGDDEELKNGKQEESKKPEQTESMIIESLEQLAITENQKPKNRT